MPTTGTAGQVLALVNNVSAGPSSGDLTWSTVSGGGGGGTYYRIAVTYATGSTSVYAYGSSSATGFTSKFTVNSTVSPITITNTSVPAGISGAQLLVPISGYILYAGAGTWANFDASPTFVYKALTAGIITVTSGATPTLNIVATFTTSTLSGSGSMTTTGDGTSRVLAYIYLQFNSSII